MKKTKTAKKKSKTASAKAGAKRSSKLGPLTENIGRAALSIANTLADNKAVHEVLDSAGLPKGLLLDRVRSLVERERAGVESFGATSVETVPTPHLDAVDRERAAAPPTEPSPTAAEMERAENSQ